MSPIQALAIVLYASGAVFAIVGPLIAVVRISVKYRKTQDELTGTWIDPAIDPDNIRAEARADAWWGVTEFGFVALGVVFASVASIILII